MISFVKINKASVLLISKRACFKKKKKKYPKELKQLIQHIEWALPRQWPMGQQLKAHYLS